MPLHHVFALLFAATAACIITAPLEAAAPPDRRPSLCAPAEAPIFSCALKTGRIVSLCASQDLAEGAGTLRYLYGRPGRPEFVHPAPGTASAFTRGIVGASGGDFIRFRHGDATYTLTSVIRRGGGEIAGLAVHRAGKTVLDTSCRDFPLGPDAFARLYRAKLPQVQYVEE